MRRSRYAAIVANYANQEAPKAVPVPERCEFVNSDDRPLLSHSQDALAVGDVTILVAETKPRDESTPTFVVEKEEVKNVTFEIQISDPTTREFVYSGIVKCGGSVVTEDGDFIVSDAERPHGNIFTVGQLKFAYEAAGITRKRKHVKVSIKNATTGETAKKAEFSAPEIMLCDSPVLSGTPFHRPAETRRKPTYGSDGSRKKTVDAPDAGYCQICGERYENKEQHRAAPGHRERAEAQELWQQFDDFAKEINFM